MIKFEFKFALGYTTSCENVMILRQKVELLQDKFVNFLVEIAKHADILQSKLFYPIKSTYIKAKN